MNTTVSTDVFERLRGVPAAVVASVLASRGYGSVFVDGLRPFGSKAHFAGEAITLRCVPAREDQVSRERVTSAEYPQRVAIEACGTDSVLVVEGRGVTSAAIGGEVYLSRLQALGAAGCVVDGSVRDSKGLRELNMPVFARGTATPPHHVRHVAVDWNVPVGICEVLVIPGDVIVGDEDGVTVIPRALVETVIDEAEEIVALEDSVLKRIREGAPLEGTFPPADSR